MSELKLSKDQAALIKSLVCVSMNEGHHSAQGDFMVANKLTAQRYKLYEQLGLETDDE